MVSPSPYRPEFEAALRLFARASEAMRARGFERPVLVGGAAVELYSGSAITTGDFDLATGRQDAFEEELLRVGFIRPVGPGTFSRGLVHPDLKLGFEVVASDLTSSWGLRWSRALRSAGHSTGRRWRWSRTSAMPRRSWCFRSRT